MTQPQRRRLRGRFPIFKGSQETAAIPVRLVRLFVIVMTLSILVVLAVVGYVVHLSEKLGHTITTNHANRIDDQAATDLKIRTIYCNQADILAELDPHSAQARRRVTQLRLDNHCRTLPSLPSSGPHGASSPASPATPGVGSSTRGVVSPTAPRSSRQPSPRPSSSPSSVPPTGRPSRPRDSSSPVQGHPSSPGPIHITLPIPSVSVCVVGVACIGGP